MKFAVLRSQYSANRFSCGVGEKRRKFKYRKTAKSWNIFNGFAYKWGAYRHRVRSEHKEGKIFGGDEREKYANILNPSNSETSKRERNDRDSPSVTDPKEAFGETFCMKIFGKYFFRFYGSPSLFAKKTQTHMRLNIIFELKVLGGNHQQGWNI